MISGAVKELFGSTGALYHPFLEAMAKEVTGVHYDFMKMEQFEDLSQNDPLEANRIYWREILYRAHWAASSNVLRHKRWLDGCVGLYSTEPNYLSFAACLRGLLESAADAIHSLKSVPRPLAESYYIVNRLLLGKTKKIAQSPYIEDSLIHYLFARKMKKGEPGPKSHVAEHMATYIRAVTVTGSAVEDLYAELCNLAHPAAQSLMWLSNTSDGCSFWIEEGNEKRLILQLCKTHRVALALYSKSVSIRQLCY